MNKFLSFVKSAIKYFVVFVLAYILLFFLCVSFINIFYTRGLIKEPMASILMYLIPFGIYIVFLTVHISDKKKRKSSFVPKLYHIKYLILFIIVINLASSIKNEVLLTLDKANFLITTQWSLFAILIALVITWCVIVDKEIKLFREKKETVAGLEQRLNLINEKKAAIISSVSYFWNIIPSIFSLLLLSIVTSGVLIDETLNIFNQSIIYFNMGLLINAIILIVMDIVSPVVAKLYLVKNQKISQQEYNDELITGVLEDKVLKDVKELVEKNSNFLLLTKDKKQELVNDILIQMKPEIDSVKNEINLQKEIDKKPAKEKKAKTKEKANDRK